MLSRTEKLALALMNIGAIQIDNSPGGGWALKDKTRSPIYVNLRTDDNPKKGPLKQQHVKEIALNLFDKAESKRLKYDAVIGIPNAGEPFAKAYSHISGVPYYSLGKQGDGENRKVIADAGLREHLAGRRILVLDDLITRALSKFEAIDAIEKVGGIVTGVLVYLNREQGGEAELNERGYPLYFVDTLKRLLGTLCGNDKITTDDHDAIMNYLDKAA